MSRERALAVVEELAGAVRVAGQRRPGLFVTGTDTGVGKTVVSCGIAAALRRWGYRVGVCKPFGSGCRKDREGLVHEDAEALAHFADCREALDVINPIRFKAPLAPAAAALELGESIDFSAIGRSLDGLSVHHDVLLVEGVGGVMVPIDPDRPGVTVLELMGALGYPAVVVARAGLGTLNHTAMTVRVMRDAGVAVLGVVINGVDTSGVEEAADPSLVSNAAWIERMTGLPVLARVPKVKERDAVVAEGRLDAAVVDALAGVDWMRLAGRG
ncbi:MAG: dethiobiotin synthase [Planctomycetota bacterium]